MPLVVIGHNSHIAWGFTTTTADVEDLFVEKIDPRDPTRYLTPEGSAAFVTRHEKILVNGGAPVDLIVRATRHGPVLSDALPAGTADPGYVLALSATFLQPGDRSAQAVWEANRANNWTSFREAWRNFVGPIQNIVYADDSGTIGFMAPGLVPIRKKGEGWMPAPGWTGDYDWTGFIPFDALPSGTNPSSGRFVSANNKIVPDSYPYFISRDWDWPDRAERINALLDATPVQTPATSAAIQADTLSLEAKRLVPLMTQISPADAASRQALDLLRQWDFRMDRDKVAPLLFTAWLRQFSRAVLFGRFGAAVAGYWDLKPDVMEAVLTERPDWCDDPKRPGTQNCASRLAESLAAALAELRASLRRQHVGMALGPGAYCGFCQPGVQPHPDLARLVLAVNFDRWCCGHGGSRPQPYSQRPASLPTGIRRRPAHHYRSRLARGFAHDRHPRPVRQPALGPLCRSAAPLARLWPARPRSRSGYVDSRTGSRK